MEYILETKNIEKRYGHFKALSNLNMHIPKGAIYGLIGKNGAGKTTLIRLICGLQKVTSGEYTIYGISNNSRKIVEARKRLGGIVETPSIIILFELHALCAETLLVSFISITESIILVVP